MSQNTDNFSNLLNHEINLLKSLQELMLDEQRQVELNHIDQLLPIAEHKRALLDQIELAVTSRDKFIRSRVQLAAGKEGIEQYLGALDQSADVKELFLELQALIDNCKRQNDTNAKIIAINQRNVERNLNIMKGIDNNAVTYNAKGTTWASSERLSGVKA